MPICWFCQKAAHVLKDIYTEGNHYFPKISIQIVSKVHVITRHKCITVFMDLCWTSWSTPSLIVTFMTDKEGI